MSRRDYYYLTGDQVAELLDVELDAVVAMCEAHELPSIRGADDEIRVPRAALEYYVEQQQGA